MKIHAIILTLILLLICGCAPKLPNNRVSDNEILRIELGKSFKHDLVKIYLDDKLLVNKTFSTVDSLIGPEILRVKHPKRPFLLTIDVNGKQIQQKSLKLKIKRSEDENFITESNINYGFRIQYDREKLEVKLDTLIQASLERKRIPELEF